MSDVQTYPAAPGPGPDAGRSAVLHPLGAGVAGAVVAAAVSFVLMTFASAVGLMIASPSPTWRDTSVWLALLSGFWIIVVTVGSFALGGYLAGRVRSTWKASEDEVEFRDGAHGLLVWALGVVLGAALLWATASDADRRQSAASAPRETAGAPAFLAYELDRLFRSERRLDPVAADVRAETSRILMKGVGRQELPADDRAHLDRLVAGATGLARAGCGAPGDPGADRGTQCHFADAPHRRDPRLLHRGRVAAAAAAAWFAAGAGGKHRDENSRRRCGLGASRRRHAA